MFRGSLGLFLAIAICTPGAAQTPEHAGPSYVLSFPKPATHMFEVVMTVSDVRDSPAGPANADLDTRFIPAERIRTQCPGL